GLAFDNKRGGEIQSSAFSLLRRDKSAFVSAAAALWRDKRTFARGRRWVRRRARERGRGRFIKGGEFVGAGEEEFEGAIEGTIALEADAGEAALDGVLASGGTFGRSGALKAEQGAEQGLGQGTGGQRSRNGIVVFPINRRMVVIRLGRNDNVRAGKIGTEGA